ncbi:hypothetical protein VTK56DRAFT_5518 [Thermocarpiscus australiensis]
MAESAKRRPISSTEPPASRWHGNVKLDRGVNGVRARRRAKHKIRLLSHRSKWMPGPRSWSFSINWTWLCDDVDAAKPHLHRDGHHNPQLQLHPRRHHHHLPRRFSPRHRQPHLVLPRCRPTPWQTRSRPPTAAPSPRSSPPPGHSATLKSTAPTPRPPRPRPHTTAQTQTQNTETDGSSSNTAAFVSFYNLHASTPASIPSTTPSLPTTTRLALKILTGGTLVLSARGRCRWRRGGASFGIARGGERTLSVRVE